MSTHINLLPPPDSSDDEALAAYNMLLNCYGINKLDFVKSTSVFVVSCNKEDNETSARAAKRMRKIRVAFRDQVGGELVDELEFLMGPMWKQNLVLLF